jgi:hypothetical protein
MPLYIRDDDVHALARRLAEAEETTVTDAVRRALARSIADLEDEVAARDRRLRALFAKWDRTPPGCPWGDADMYDEDGAPR